MGGRAVIETIANGFGSACLWLGLVGILAVAGAAIAISFRRMVRAARPCVKGTNAAVLLGLAAVCTIYGGRKGTITYPYTDYELRYLVDNGSYVSNDYVHVSFTRIVAPATADFFISFRQVDSTNDIDWAVFTNTTFAALSIPFDIPYANATNYDWICYTTWTPGPTVQTNGVWHSYWGRDKKLHTHIIPIRSAIRVNGETIATPKSKREANQ